MPVTPSPLRYPGGKTAITPMVETIIKKMECVVLIMLSHMQVEQD